MKKIVKIPLIIILVLIVLTFVIRLALPLVAVRIANHKLPELLNTEATVGSLHLRLLSGGVSIRDLRIAQPEGFGEGDLLRVPEARVRVKLFSLLSGPLTVEEVVCTDWEINLVKNRKGVMNTDVLLPESSPAPGPSPRPKAEGEGEEGSPGQPILVRVFSIENLSFSYLDRSIAAPAAEFEEAEGKTASGEGEVIILDEKMKAKPAESSEGKAGEKAAEEDGESLRLRIADLYLLLENLRIDPGASPESIAPAEAVLTARIIQPPFSDGLIGLAARIGPVGGDLPAINAVGRLGDLELKPIAVVVPNGTAQVLGGSALDVAADLALASYLLDCEIEVEAAGGHVIPLAIGGTPEKPEIDQSSILLGVMLHLGGGVGHLVGNIGGAGFELASGATKTTWAVGKGAVNVVGSIGGGLFKTVTSAATGDLEGTVEGLSDTTVGTAGTVGEAAADVAGEVAEGATSTADSTTGADDDRRWRADTPRRWNEDWSAAQKKLEEMPFPPPRPEEESPNDDAENSASAGPATAPTPVPVGTPLDF